MLSPLERVQIMSFHAYMVKKNPLLIQIKGRKAHQGHTCYLCNYKWITCILGHAALHGEDQKETKTQLEKHTCWKLK